MAEQDLMFTSVYDAATADNVAVRNNAVNTAAAGRGMVGAYGSALAGGVFSQSLAKMAGMKSPEEQKADIISKILKGSSNLDRSNPANLEKIAQQLIQQGLPGEAQKFIEKAREMRKTARTFQQKETELGILQQSADARTRDADTNAERLAIEKYSAETTRLGVDNQHIVALKRLGLDEYIWEDKSSMEVWKHSTTNALQNKIADNNFALGTDQNTINATNTAINYYLAGFKPQELALSKRLADIEEGKAITDAYYKAGQLLYQDASLKSQNDVNRFNMEMGGEVMNVLLPNGQSGVGHMAWDSDTQTASFKLLSTGTPGEGEGGLNDVLMTGTASQIQDAMITASGINSEEQTVVKNVTYDYEKIFLAKNAQFGDQWRIPETGPFSDEWMEARGLDPLIEVPNLLDYAKAMGLENDPNYLQSNQWQLLHKGRGLDFVNLYDKANDSEKYQEKVVSAEVKGEIMSAYPGLITNESMLDTVIDMPVMNGIDYGSMTLANVIRTLNAHTWETNIPGTLRTKQNKLTGDNIKVAIKRILDSLPAAPAPAASNNQDVVASGAAVVVDNTVPSDLSDGNFAGTNTNIVNENSEVINNVDLSNITNADMVVQQIEPSEAASVIASTGYDSLIKSLEVLRVDKKQSGDITHLVSPIFDMSTEEGRKAKAAYDQWKFKNGGRYLKMGIRLPPSTIMRK